MHLILKKSGEYVVYASAFILSYAMMSVSLVAAPPPLKVSPEQKAELCSFGTSRQGSYTANKDAVATILDVMGANNVDANALGRKIVNPFASISGGQPGHNLYQQAYAAITQGPQEAAVKAVIESSGLQQHEVTALLNGSVDPNAFTKPGEFLSYNEALRKAENFKEVFNELVQTKQMEQKVAMDVKITELFSNGDVQDSGGFDLLNDLDMIDYILFDDKAKKSFGAGTDFLNALDKATVNALRANDNLRNPETTPNATPSATPTPTASASASPTPSFTPNPQSNRAMCFADPTLEAQIQAQRAAKTNPTQEEQAAEEEKKQVGSGVDTAFSDDSDKPQYDLGKQLPGETPAPESLSQLCNEFFCFEIDFKKKQQSLFTNKATCVACQVDEIKQTLDKVISKNGIPNKVSGNIFEMPKCKRAGLSVPVNLNFIVVTEPIETPPQTKIVGTDYMADFSELLQTTLGDTYYDLKLDRFETDTSRVTQRVLSAVPNDADVSQIYSVIDRRLSAAADKAETDFNNTIQKNKIRGNNDLYAGIEAEIETFKAYFESMKKAYERVNSSACPTLKNKKTCQ